jgi:hypothetical protein
MDFQSLGTAELLIIVGLCGSGILVVAIGVVVWLVRKNRNRDR